MQNQLKKEIEFSTIINCEMKVLPRDFICEMHCHDHIEFEMVIEGEAKQAQNSEILTLKEGSAYIISPRRYHAIYALSNLKLFHIEFNPIILDKEIFNLLSIITNKNLCINLDDKKISIIKDKIITLLNEQKNKQAFSSAMSRSLLNEIIIEFLRSSKNVFIQNLTLSQKIIAYIDENFKRNISVAEIAKTFSISPNYTGKIFKQQTGFSLNEYLNNIRLKYACNMLKYSNLAIKEIATLSGYNSLEYFFYSFKKNFEITPTEFRNL